MHSNHRVLRRRRQRFGALAIIAALALVVASCGDDDDDNGATGDETTTTAATGDLAAFCEDYLVLAVAEFGPPDPSVDMEAVAQRAQANAPEEIADDVAALMAASEPEGEAGEIPDETDTEGTSTEGTNGEGGEEGGAPPEEFLEASAAVGTYVAENCTDDQIEVTAIDYEFEGIPETLTAGQYGWLLDNEGDEWHEIFLVKKNEGVTQSFDELVQLPDDEAIEYVQVVGVAFAGPGESTGTYTELEPGEYAAVCFIPVGTTGLDVESDGAPHHTEGMLHEFTVNAA